MYKLAAVDAGNPRGLNAVESGPVAHLPYSDNSDVGAKILVASATAFVSFSLPSLPYGAQPVSNVLL